jgi:hypothetical protein
MSPEAFEEKIIALKHREPFQPFIVELVDGRRIVVDNSGIVVSGGGAGFISNDDALVDIDHQDVRRILAPEEQDANA